MAHSLVKAHILRRFIRHGTGTDGAAASSDTGADYTVHASNRRQLIDDLVGASNDVDIQNEYKAVSDIIASLPHHHQSSGRSAADSIPRTGAESVWGADNLSPAFLDAVESFGKACPDPGNFQASLLAIVTCQSYSEGIRRNLLAGGCNCSRANFVGACLGAAYGIGEENGIPLEWISRTDKAFETLELAIKLCKPQA